MKLPEATMNNLIIYLAVSALFYAINLLIPVFMKPSIWFGVRLPSGNENELFVKATKRQFRVLVSLLFLGYLLITLVILKYYFTNDLFEGLILGQVIIYLAAVFHFNKKTLQWKKRTQTNLSAQDKVIIDTAFRQGKLTVSPWWFVVSFAVVFAHFLFVNLKYDQFPQRLAVHYNIQGQADRFVQKSWWAVNQLPVISLGIVLLMLGIFYVIKRSRQEIDPSNPKISLQQDRKFRIYWSGYVALISVLMPVYFFYFSYAILVGHFITWAVWAFPALIILLTIGLALYTGQSGYRLKTTMTDSGQIKAMRNDDRYWIGGILYCNKKDPAVFVEKRVGVGWTINICNTWGVLILIAVLLLILIPAFL